jgi:transcriptional regulator with XRE-family HTH domain
MVEIRRAELARRRRTVGLTQQDLAESLRVDVRSVGRWEAGTGEPQPWLRAELARALQVTADGLEDLLRIEHHDPAAPGVLGRTLVTSADAEQIEQLAINLTTWDHAHGGSLARIAALAQARWAVELLEAPADPMMRVAVATATAQLCLAAGHMAFDAQCHDDARSMFDFALKCAREANNRRLEAKALSHQARQAIWCGQPDDALPLLNSAVRLPGLSGSEMAMLYTGQARAHARLRRVRDALVAVDNADRAFEQHQTEDTPTWMTYYDRAQHLGDTGHALFDLALAGHQGPEAVARLRGAVEGHDRGHPRSQVFSRTKLATLLFACGDPQEAVEVGLPSLEQVESLRSMRAVAGLREMLHFATPHRRLQDVAELRSLARLAAA